MTTENPQGHGHVAEVIDLLRAIEVLEAQAAELRPKVAQLAETEKQLTEQRAVLGQRLRAMDLESPGNFGWEGRMGWFVGEMRRQIVAAQKRGGK